MHEQELYTIAQIRQLERLVIDQSIDEFELMKKAGRAAFNYLVLNWPNADKIHVICGQGNNGGDGYVLAYHAKQGGLDVTLHCVGDFKKMTPCAKQALSLCESIDLFPQSFDFSALARADLIVDGLLGIGIKNEVREIHRHVIEQINRAGAPVLAIDVPSGLDANTGAVLGSAIRATKTITFIGLKQGLFTNDGPDQAGDVHLSTLDIKEQFYRSVTTEVVLAHSSLVKKMPKRLKNSQKGDFGHVLIVGGYKGMAGAARLTAEAALRVGAGLVSVATYPGNAAIVNAQYPEIMCHEIQAATELTHLLTKATVVVIGPGLGQEQWGRELLQAILTVTQPLLLDADALNMLKTTDTVRETWILTPHPGEAARLLIMSSGYEVQKDRFAAISQLAERGGTWVLKGAGSLIKERESDTTLCPYGNPGMASGGMGDALSGVIAGLVAQRMSIRFSTELGVILHALAGDAAAKKGQRGLVVSDLIAALPETIEWYRQK